MKTIADYSAEYRAADRSTEARLARIEKQLSRIEALLSKPQPVGTAVGQVITLPAHNTADTL